MRDSDELIDPFAALRTAQGRALVEHLSPWDADLALSRVAAARRDPRWRDQPDLVSAAATQARLRTRAAARFPGPPRWWTPEGLEQATRPVVGRRHAERLVDAGVRRVVDLGCGNGSDALAFAGAGLEVLAVDLDAQALAALDASAADLGRSIELLRADITDPLQEWNRGPLPMGTALFLDPSRRHAGRRTLAPQSWSPPWEWVCQLAARRGAVGAKVAPGIDRARLPDSTQVEWVSVDGDLVEATVWWGMLRIGAAGRQATLLRGDRSDGRADVHVLTDIGGVPPGVTGPVGSWLLEPDPAVLRAALVTVLAQELGAHQLHPEIAYLSGDGAAPQTALGTVWTVCDEVPFGRKHLREWLRRAGFGDVVIKKRGINVVPEELRHWLRLDGLGRTATLVLTRTESGPLALRVERVPPADADPPVSRPRTPGPPAR